MPPSTQPKNERLYRLFYLIAQKSDQTGKDKNEIIIELLELLKITRHRFYQISNQRIGTPARLSIEQLLALTQYFACNLEDLIHRSLQTTSHSSGTPISEDESGASSIIES